MEDAQSQGGQSSTSSQRRKIRQKNASDDKDIMLQNDVESNEDLNIEEKNIQQQEDQMDCSKNPSNSPINQLSQDPPNPIQLDTDDQEDKPDLGWMYADFIFSIIKWLICLGFIIKFSELISDYSEKLDRDTKNLKENDKFENYLIFINFTTGFMIFHIIFQIFSLIVQTILFYREVKEVKNKQQQEKLYQKQQQKQQHKLQQSKKIKKAKSKEFDNYDFTQNNIYVDQQEHQKNLQQQQNIRKQGIYPDDEDFTTEEIIQKASQYITGLISGISNLYWWSACLYFCAFSVSFDGEYEKFTQTKYSTFSRVKNFSLAIVIVLPILNIISAFFGLVQFLARSRKNDKVIQL